MIVANARLESKIDRVLSPGQQEKLKGLQRTHESVTWKQIGESSSKEFLTPDTLDAGKSPVEITCGADQCEMCERLREIPKMPPVGTQLF